MNVSATASSDNVDKVQQTRANSNKEGYVFDNKTLIHTRGLGYLVLLTKNRLLFIVKCSTGN